MGRESGSALHLKADLPHIAEGRRQECYQLLFVALHGANAAQKRDSPYCCKAGELVWAIWCFPLFNILVRYLKALQLF